MPRLIFALLLGWAFAMSAAVPPNVVLIISDDQAWTDYGFMGHPVIQTPHLDRLAAESARFKNGYVPSSLCRASLATLLTGLYGHQHKICCNDPPDGVDRAAMLPFLKQAPALPRLLQRQGYVSLQTGKFWEGHFSNGGFTHGMTTRGRHGEEGLVIGRQTMEPIYRFIAERGDRPFFLWYAPMLPHEPHNPPEHLLAKYRSPELPEKLAKYYAMVEWFDATCGELLQHLDSKGLRENTLVIYVTDNGWIQETGAVRTTRGWFAPRSKNSPYDGGVRTPILLRWPGRVRPGDYPDLVSTIDIAPTILAATGLRKEPKMEGLSLLDRAAGGRPLRRSAVFGEIFLHTATDLDRPGLNLTHLWMREGDWKLILNKEDDSVELFDLKKDPFEKSNLAPQEPRRASRMNKTLAKWWSSH
jgi:arylsulfatase A-like enzyme